MATRTSAKRITGHSAGAPAHRVTRQFLGQQLALAESLVPAVLEGEGGGEPLHDLRVALRRTRSLAQLLGGVFAERTTRDLVAQLRALAEPTGELRDLDVHLEACGDQLDALPARLRPAGQRVCEVLRGLRAEANTHLTDELSGDAYRERLASLRGRLGDPQAWPSGPLADLSIRDAAAGAVVERYRSVHKRAGRLGLDTPEGQVHRLRIACKKLRYALEFFAPVLEVPEQLAPLRRRLKKAQNLLGHFNDCTVQRDRLLSLPWDGAEPETTLTAGVLAGLLQAEIHAARPALMKAAHGLCEAPLERRVARLRSE